LQLSLTRSRTHVRSLAHSTCALPADPNPSPNPKVSETDIGSAKDPLLSVSSTKQFVWTLTEAFGFV